MRFTEAIVLGDRGMSLVQSSADCLVVASSTGRQSGTGNPNGFFTCSLKLLAEKTWVFWDEH